MKPLKKSLIYFALAGVLAGFTSAASANEVPSLEPTAEQIAGDAAQAQLLADLAALNADRYGAIEGIKAIWGDNYDFADSLDRANDKQLIDVQSAGNFDEVRAILQGREVALDLDGVIGTEQVGERTRDLVFTPVQPCRFFDTRFDNVAGVGHTSGSIATSRSYLVWGSAAQLVHQGHTANTGCPAPFGEPSGIHANFTAVPVAGSGGGNLRAFPVGGALPSVSLVNYRAGVNIANAASIASRFLSSSSDDIWVTTQFASADSIGDVMGYYYPVRQEIPYQITSAGTTFGTSTACQNVASLTVFPNSRGYWDVEATIQLWIDTGSASSNERVSTFLTTSPTNCSGQLVEQWHLDANQEMINNVFIQNRFLTTSTAAEVFYLNVTTSGDTGSEIIVSRGETMSATFYASP